MASVAIELTDGRTLEAVEVHPLGSPRNPASGEQLDAKARSLAGAVLGTERTERLIEMVRTSKRYPMSVRSEPCSLPTRRNREPHRVPP